MPRAESDPMPALVRRTIRVTVPRAVLYDLTKMQKVQSNILGRLGCVGCTSGLYIRWEEESEFFINEQNLNVVPVFAGGGLRGE